MFYQSRRGPVDPVQVIDHHDYRLYFGHALEEAPHRTHQLRTQALSSEVANSIGIGCRHLETKESGNVGQDFPMVGWHQKGERFLDGCPILGLIRTLLNAEPRLQHFDEW